MGSIHADLSAQHKALPHVFTSETCVSDKCRLTSGETSSRQSDCKAGLMSSSEPCLAKCSVLIFRKTTEKLGFDHFLFTPWDCHKAQRYQKMWTSEGMYTMSTQYLHSGSQRLFHWLFFKSEAIHVFHHIFFAIPHVMHTPEHMQANTLTPNTRLFARKLNTRAATERNTALYLKCWYQHNNSSPFRLPSLYYGLHHVHPPGPQTVGVNYHFCGYKVCARSKFLIPHLLPTLARMQVNISKYMTKAFRTRPCINKCYFVLMTSVMTESYRAANAGHLVYFTWNGTPLDTTFPKLLA